MRCNDSGDPLFFFWDSQAQQIEEVVKRWHVDDEWWLERKWRDYFKLITSTGLLVIVFRDCADGNWYLQRVYD